MRWLRVHHHLSLYQTTPQNCMSLTGSWEWERFFSITSFHKLSQVANFSLNPFWRLPKRRFSLFDSLNTWHPPLEDPSFSPTAKWSFKGSLILFPLSFPYPSLPLGHLWAVHRHIWFSPAQKHSDFQSILRTGRQTYRITLLTMFSRSENSNVSNITHSDGYLKYENFITFQKCRIFDSY